MRNPNFRFVGLWAKQFGGGGLAVGDITLAFTNPDALRFHDATVAEILPVGTYPELYAVTGGGTGKTVQTAAALANTLSFTSRVIGYKGVLFAVDVSGNLLRTLVALWGLGR